MTRNYVPKNKQGETQDALSSVVETRSDRHGFPRNQFTPAMQPDRAHFTHLAMWLTEFSTNGDHLEFSMLLQVWLHINGFGWPKGVFKNDLTSAGRGRPRSDLGFWAFSLYKPKVFGWLKVAKRLVPDRFKANRYEAAKYVKDLAETARSHEEERPLGSTLHSGCFLLGVQAFQEKQEED